LSQLNRIIYHHENNKLEEINIVTVE